MLSNYGVSLCITNVIIWHGWKFQYKPTDLLSSERCRRCSTGVCCNAGHPLPDCVPRHGWLTRREVSYNCATFGSAERAVHLGHGWQHRTGELWYRADSRFAASQWETTLLCNNVPHWLGASLESALMIWGLVCQKQVSKSGTSKFSVVSL